MIEMLKSGRTETTCTVEQRSSPIVNQKVARALGVTLPGSVLLLADEVIE